MSESWPATGPGSGLRCFATPRESVAVVSGRPAGENPVRFVQVTLVPRRAGLPCASCTWTPKSIGSGVFTGPVWPTPRILVIWDATPAWAVRVKTATRVVSKFRTATGKVPAMAPKTACTATLPFASVLAESALSVIPAVCQKIQAFGMGVPTPSFSCTIRESVRVLRTVSTWASPKTLARSAGAPLMAVSSKTTAPAPPTSWAWTWIAPGVPGRVRVTCA